MPKHKLIIFDMGGVVLGSPVQAISLYAQHKFCDPHELHGLMANSPAFHELEKGTIALPEFLSAFQHELDLAGLSKNDIIAKEIITELFRAAVPRPHVLDALSKLRQAGFVVVALTNNFKVRKSDLRGSDMAQFDAVFDAVFESCVLVMRKPEPGIYQHVLDVFGVQPQQCVFIDDLGRNLKAAKALGMHVIRAVDDGTFLTELGQLLDLPLWVPPPNKRAKL